MKLQIIAEASIKYEILFKNWGLSVLIDNKILFDTFSNYKILEKNFKKNKINIEKIEYVVISHEHWDHTGGLWWFLENNNNVTVILNKSFSKEFKEIVKSYKVKIIELESSFYQITDNIFSTGEIIGLYNNKKIYEQSLVIKKNDEIILLTGCAHPGIINIVQKVHDEFNKKISLLLGGFHLSNKSSYELKKTALQLKNHNQIGEIAPCHCTGGKAVQIIKRIFKNNYIKVYSNKTLEI
ncbi:MAG: MBL fold metallo-hydrolase [Spirochaetes bacterium]|nr:MBL fold metallo-hydrolase [Spirochaetota bacterium]